MALELDGHSVQVAYDGRSGLVAASTTRPEVAILDIGLPEMDGIELAHALRQQYGKDLRLIACTGYADDTTRRRMASAGFDHTFMKPVSLEALIGTVNEKGDAVSTSL